MPRKHFAATACLVLLSSSHLALADTPRPPALEAATGDVGSEATTAGPVFTAIGATAYIGGSVVAGVGAGLRACDAPDQGCSAPRAGLILGGMGSALTFGLFSLLHGSSLWAQDLGEAPEEHDDELPRADAGLLVGGLVLMTAGTVAQVAALLASLAPTSTMSGSEHPFGSATGATMIIAGGTGIAIGVPMLGIGARKLPVAPSLGSGGLSVRASGRF